MLPLISLNKVIPTITTRNTTAKATDNADVNLNESAQQNKELRLATLHR